MLAQENGRERFVQAVVELSKAFALSVPRDEALAIRDEVGFFQAVKAALVEDGSRSRARGGGSRPRDQADRRGRDRAAAR